MAILRAGPWGNITNSFQSVPSNTGADGLTAYPVNCAKANWPKQQWAAYYEVEPVAGCLSPIYATWPVTSNFGSTVTYTSQTIEANEDCNYFYAQFPDSYYRGYVFALTGGDQCYFGNETFAQADSILLDITATPEPTGVTTISGTYYYDGYTITITDPNA